MKKESFKIQSSAGGGFSFLAPGDWQDCRVDRASGAEAGQLAKVHRYFLLFVYSEARALVTVVHMNEGFGLHRFPLDILQGIP